MRAPTGYTYRVLAAQEWLPGDVLVRAGARVRRAPVRLANGTVRIEFMDGTGNWMPGQRLAVFRPSRLMPQP